jgi:hypothetical protein
LRTGLHRPHFPRGQRRERRVPSLPSRERQRTR